MSVFFTLILCWYRRKIMCRWLFTKQSKSYNRTSLFTIASSHFDNALSIESGIFYQINIFHLFENMYLCHRKIFTLFTKFRWISFIKTKKERMRRQKKIRKEEQKKNKHYKISKLHEIFPFECDYIISFTDKSLILE